MRIEYWKRVYVRKNITIWENTRNKKRVYVARNDRASWKFGNYKEITKIFNDIPTLSLHTNYVRNRKAAFEYAVKYMRDNPK